MAIFYYFYPFPTFYIKIPINYLLMDFQDQSQPYQSQLLSNPVHDFEDQNRPKDFSSVQKYVKMPDLRKVQPHENVFPGVEDELRQSSKISPELKQSMIDLRDKLRNEFTTFEESKYFKFTFPESKFPPVQPGTRNLITYQQKNIVQEEDTFRDKLSPEQIEQIAQNGQFKVRSNHEYITLPYVWKVNDSIFKGKQNIELAWCKNIARAHSILNNAKLQVIKGIPTEIGKIKKLPMRLFSLFFGKRSMQNSYEVNHEREVAKDFWEEVMSKHYQKSKEWGSELWEYLDTKMKAQDFMTINKTQHPEDDQQAQKQSTKIYDQKVKEQSEAKKRYNSRVKSSHEKKEKIAKVGDEFERKWAKGKKKVFQQVSAEYEKQKENSVPNENSGNESQELIKARQKVSEQQILQRFNARKFQNYTLFLQKRLPALDIPHGVIQAITTMLTLMQIITRKQRKLDGRLKQQKQKVQTQIKQQHKIKQYDYRWYNDELQRVYKPIETRITEEYMNRLVDVELIKRLNMRQKEVHNLWLEYRAKYGALIQAKRRQLPELQQPTRTFYSTYLLFPPYKIIKHSQTTYTWYQMVRQAKVQITTAHNFWKLDLYLMRVKSWSINCIIFLVYSCWKGNFGLRCLYGTELFKYDQRIDYNTGEITDLKRKPVLAVFNTVLQGVKKSRQHFEALPDRGLFGKNFSRVFNYAQCYIFRFFFVGVILTLILYPIAIVSLSILSFLMILTVWAWMPVVLFITYLFNTIFFQFQSSTIPYGFFIRATPLLSLVISLIVSLVKIVLYLVYLSTLAPIGSLLVSLWGGFMRAFRTLTDTVMLFFIKKLGRTPSRNTAIAKKISGPGMSKQYYMSINQQDVYILIQSQLQQLFMSQYNRLFHQQVNTPVDRFHQALRLLIAPLTPALYYPPQAQNVIAQSVNQLRNNYAVQYQNYMNRYPTRPYNIRFTQQELDSYFENTVMIVKNFVSKNGIATWIFDHYHILQDYQELTRKLWMAVFSCGQQIFQPLQKIDQRFKLQDMYKSNNNNGQQLDEYSTSFSNAKMKKNVHKVMEALEGEVELKPRRAHLNAFKHSLMTREISAVGVREVFQYMDINANGNVQLDTNNPKGVFFVNLAIKEIIKKDTHEYEWRKEQNSKLLSK